jgi:hypothetical protein
VNFKTFVSVATLAAAVGITPSATAAVTSVGAAGFAIHIEADSAREPAALWARTTRPQEWWDSGHTFSGDAGNLSLELVPGGCWCEALPGGGFVRHMAVAYAAPGKVLRLTGGLGPLQGLGLGGALTFMMKPAASGHTLLVVDYYVSGYVPKGFDELAKAVDEVLGEQVARLAAP